MSKPKLKFNFNNINNIININNINNINNKTLTPIKENTTYIKNKPNNIIIDKYTSELLKTQYEIHKKYYLERGKASTLIGKNIRLSGIPEDISENIIKFIIHKNGDKSCHWSLVGDLYSERVGKIECKSFTSNGPISFSPIPNWNQIYFLDCRKWNDDIFKLYQCTLKHSDLSWRMIKINHSQTFYDQSDKARRPRITWKSLYPQIKDHCKLVYEGLFDDIFI